MRAREQDEYVVRRTTEADLPDVVALAARSLGWAGDERDRAYLAWKHHENPFGPSPSWAAFDGDRMVAFRTMLRWRFVRGDERLAMVRAVDTATDPDHQGRGLFRRLTSQAVEELAAEGTDAVYNTPNDQSRPGYLKMGWTVLGHPTLRVRARGPRTLARMVRSRVAAEKWSPDPGVGAPVRELDTVPGRQPERWATPRTLDYLHWRYGFEPLHYRAVEVRGGAAIIRVRRRGPLREVAVCEWLSDDDDPASVRRLVRACGDYAVGVGPGLGRTSIPLPRQGPVVTWRPLAGGGPPRLDDLELALGDLELL